MTMREDIAGVDPMPLINDRLDVIMSAEALMLLVNQKTEMERKQILGRETEVLQNRFIDTKRGVV